MTGKILPAMLAAMLIWPLAAEAKGGDPAEVSSALATVVFSNGGRILKMNADGSDRKVLFGKHRRPENDGLGAIEPSVSPDGEKITFGFRREARYEKLIDIWVMDSDGSHARKLFRSSLDRRFGDPDFGPDGKIVAASFRKNSRLGVARIFSVKTDGKGFRTIYRLRQKARPWVSWKSLAEPAVSPDGKRLLYLLDPGYDGTYFENGYKSALRVMNLESGASRELSEYSLGGAWSPDGRRIALSEVDSSGDEDFCWNADYTCLDYSRIRIINADGTGARDLTRGVADERRPDWSGDGRIVFQATRGKFRDIGETTEIWSVRPTGRCLTRLTNGSPASLDPVWSDPEGAATAPVGCGAKPPGPYRELQPLPATISNVGDLWLGANFRNLMLSYTESEPQNSSLIYGDCGAIPETKCGRMLIIYNTDVCQSRGYAAAFFGSGAVRRQRGIPLFLSLKPGRETPPFTVGLSGRNLFFMIGGSGVGDHSRQNRKEVDALRPVGASFTGLDLPAPRIPTGDIRAMKKVKRVYDRTGSVARTAEIVGRGEYFVRSNIRFARSFKAGDYGRVNCPRSGGTRTDAGNDSSGSSLRHLLAGRP